MSEPRVRTWLAWVVDCDVCGHVAVARNQDEAEALRLEHRAAHVHEERMRRELATW